MSVGRLAAPLALAVGLVACGGDDESTATTTVTTFATTSVPTTTTTTTPTASTVASTGGSSTTTVAVSCGSGLSIDADGSLRDQFVGYLASCGFTPDEAACLYDHLDFTDPSVAGGESGPIIAAFGECGIDQARAAEIGG